MKKNILFLALLFTQFVTSGQTDSSNFINGVDISFSQQIEDLGGKYKEDGVEKDILEILLNHDINYIRLRIWNDPVDGYNNLEKILEYAARIKAKGMKFLLDFHYSDWWADPGQQNKPAAWANLSFQELKDSVYAYSNYVVTALKNQNTLPDMVQVGNEITGGMLWPEGKIYGVVQGGAWTNFSELVKEGIRGVNDAADNDSVRIMIHIDRGGNNNDSRYFYDHIIAQGVEFDVIGLSYYPWWHGTFDNLKNNMTNLALRYHKDIVVVETAYPMNHTWLNDGMGNVDFDPNELLSGYPASVAGQKDFLIALSKIIRDTPNGRGIGLFYWEPAYISVPPIGSSWEYFTLFDPVTGEALSSLDAFINQDSLESIKVKVRLNTSTNSDSLSENGFAVIVGQINGIGTNFLPSGEKLSWDKNSDLIMENIDGDNWEYEFEMYPEDQIEFKFWTGLTKSIPTFPRLGWEGPITPFDNSNKNARLFNAGFEDTTLQIQYYNSNGEYVSQYYSPIVAKEDSIGIMFRVYMGDLINNDLFNPLIHGPVAVRGDSLNSSGVLSWNSNNIILNREILDTKDSLFWSGVSYFPKNEIVEGSQIKYKFYIGGTSFGGWESGISDRIFVFPTADTTLAWKYFNNKITLTDVNDNVSLIPTETKLLPNYPNPFNPSTTLKFNIEKSGKVRLSIYNIIGEEVKVIVNSHLANGSYEYDWDGKNNNGEIQSSGIYIVRLATHNKILTNKLVMLK